MKIYLNLFDFRQKVNYTTKVLSGLTVALAWIKFLALQTTFVGDLASIKGCFRPLLFARL